MTSLPIARALLWCALPALATAALAQSPGTSPSPPVAPYPAQASWAWPTTSAQSVGTVSDRDPARTGPSEADSGVAGSAGAASANRPSRWSGYTIPGLGTIGPDGRLQAPGAGRVTGPDATRRSSVAVPPIGGPIPPAAAGLSTTEVGSGLKSALAQGLSTAVASLGRPDGFYGTPYRIPLPGALQQTAGVLRSVGMGGLVDQLDLSLNRAAEQAVPQATDVFGAALRQMTLTDAWAILRGGDTAATDYFRARTGAELVRRFRPIVSQATAQVGAVQLYNQAIASAGPLGAAVGFNTDLDTYVTQQATSALFDQIAQQEIAIRRQPVARTTDLLRRVFGGAG